MELSEIMQFEENAEAIFIGAFSSVCPNVYGSRGVDTNKTPRISVSVIVGGQFQNQMLQIADAPGFIHSAFECRAEFTVTTNRTEEATSGAHNTLVGKVAMRCSQFYIQQLMAEQVWPLPNLILMLKPAESDNAEQDAENLDSTTLAVTFISVINPAALTQNT